MKLFKKMKDGGPESTVTGYWLIESKRLFSICLLKFEGRSREAFHNHAFNSIAWVLKGKITETMLDGSLREHRAGFKPFIVTREDFHRVDSVGNSWVLNFRGPWTKTWNESIDGEKITLTDGRRRVA